MPLDTHMGTGTLSNRPSLMSYQGYHIETHCLRQANAQILMVDIMLLSALPSLPNKGSVIDRCSEMVHNKYYVHYPDPCASTPC